MTLSLQLDPSRSQTLKAIRFKQLSNRPIRKQL